MVRTTYSPEPFGEEAEAPSGYYCPLGEEVFEFEGKQVLCVLGTACIDASCCGVSDWQYARVEGYLVDETYVPAVASGADVGADRGAVAIDTIEGARERAAISRSLAERYPGIRVEFR